MSESKLLSLIDEEIARLQKVRSLLEVAGSAGSGSPSIRSGRKAIKQLSAKQRSAPRSKRKMSPEGRARIAAAQKKRWAALKKAKSAVK